MYDVSKWGVEASIKDLDTAFRNFYQKRAKYPKFHKKGRKDRFRIDGSVVAKGIEVKNVGFTLDSVKNVQCNNIVYGRKWFASINMEIPNQVDKNQVGMVGIDLGLKEAAVLSDGQVFPNPHLQQENYKKLRQLSKSVSRKVKWSCNWQKAIKRLSKFHYRMACCRNDWIHKFTSLVVDQYGVICLEDLNVIGMVRNHKLSKAILDVSFFEIRRQFEYKAKEVRIVSRFSPTCKTCHACDWKAEDQRLNDRTFVCGQCGLVENRDLNAAKNILRWATPIESVAKNALVKLSGLMKRSRGQKVNTESSR